MSKNDILYIYKLKDNRIYAVWMPMALPEWGEFDQFDAGPDGLSGKKEGFYFANHMLPYKIPIMVNGIAISPSNYPECLDNGINKTNCVRCTFFNVNNCPIISDQSHFELTIRGFITYKDLIYSPRGYMEYWGSDYYEIFNTAREELLIHGRPIHYKLLSRMIQERHPELYCTDRKLHQLLKINPIFFRSIDNETFYAIPGITPNNERQQPWIKELQEILYGSEDSLEQDPAHAELREILSNLKNMH